MGSHLPLKKSSLEMRSDLQTPHVRQCLRLEREPGELSCGENFSNEPVPLRDFSARRKFSEENILTHFYGMGRRWDLELKVNLIFNHTLTLPYKVLFENFRFFMGEIIGPATVFLPISCVISFREVHLSQPSPRLPGVFHITIFFASLWFSIICWSSYQQICSYSINYFFNKELSAIRVR